jgi:hypothetical protein
MKKFGHSVSQTVFKDCANLNLKGSTFDAMHMDKFLGTEYCNKNLVSNYATSPGTNPLVETKSFNKFPSQIDTIKKTGVRPSHAFTSLVRGQ